MAAAYLFSPLDHRRPDDVRAAAYESTGLQILTGKGEWLWRPVSNRETLQISAFADVNPRGFGLLAAQPDIRRVLRRRDALGAEALACGSNRSATGRRAISVSSKFPADSETNENIIAQWRPKAGMTAATIQSIAYPPVLVLVAAVEAAARRRASRRGAARSATASASRSRWRADMFADPAKAAAATADIQAAPGKIVIGAAFSLQGQTFGARGLRSRPRIGNLSELRLTLRVDNQPASETWLYRWTA